MKPDGPKYLGKYTLQFHAVLNESGAIMYADRELPSHRIKFSIVGKTYSIVNKIVGTDNIENNQ